MSVDAIFDGDYLIAEAGRRNRNFKVIRRKQPGLFIKQIKTPDPQAIATIQREAAFYKAVHSDPRVAALSSLIPQLIDYEPRRQAIALSLADPAESMAEQQWRAGAFPENSARLLGNTLATVQAQGAALLQHPDARSLFPMQMPWPLMLDQVGLSFLDTYGSSGPQLSAAIRQSPSLQLRLSELRPLWRYDSLIHGDMKWDNCLVQDSRMTIVDWELADIGDGAWDVAAIFKEYLVTAMFSAHNRQVGNPAATHTIESLQPSIRSFWSGYAGSRGLTASESSVFLDRSVRFTGARMILAVLEYVAGAQPFEPLGSAMLQAASNILEAPQVAAGQLIGSAS